MLRDLTSRLLVPPGVLSVLPGTGIITGKDIVSNPLIRKVDITVRAFNLCLSTQILMITRLEQKLGDPWVRSSVQIWPLIQPSWAEK